MTKNDDASENFCDGRDVVSEMAFDFSSLLTFINVTLNSFHKLNFSDCKLHTQQVTFLRAISRKLVKDINKDLNIKKPFKRSKFCKHLHKSKNVKGGNRSQNAPLTNHFSVSFCNTRSLFNKLNLIYTHLHTENLDIIFFTETWLSKNISDSMIKPNGYEVLRQDRSVSKGGGVCMFFKSQLMVNEIKYNNPNKALEEKFEYLCTDVHDGKHRIRFCCIYIPPCSSRNLEVIKYICRIIAKLSSCTSTPFYLIGDFNLPLINWNIPASEGDSAHDAFLTFVLSQSFHQFIDVPTHEKGNILDLLLCNIPAKHQLLNHYVSSPITSTCDHNLISFKIQRPNLLPVQPPIQYPNYSKADYTPIYQELIYTDWSDITNSSLTLQEKYDCFLSILHAQVDRYVPLTKSTPGKSIKKPYNLRKLLKEKLHIYKQCKHDTTLKPKFKELSKRYETAVKEWHNNMESSLCNSPSSKKFFKYVKQKLKSKSPIPPLYDDQENLVMSDSNKADLFNQFFQSVFIQDDGKTLHQTPSPTPEMETFDISYVEILDAVFNSKDKISRTPDKIPMYFIKRIIGPILEPLLFLFNSFLQFSFVPTQWKQARVIPVFKKGNRSKVENYRPISLTSSFCRLFESILSKRVLHHLQENNLLSEKQFGFLPKRSTCSNLFTCYYKWLVSFSSNKITNIIYTDISKAFDTVSHAKLLTILQNCKLHKTILDWINNFLHNRHQQVAIGSALSAPLPVCSGVPQGSVIGPLLFLIYINGITNCSQVLQTTGDISLFADDAKVFSTDPDLLQKSLDLLTSWTKNVQLNLAPNKCFTVQICKPNRQQPKNFMLDNHQLASTSSIRDLGIHISSDLKWGNHIYSIYNKASVISYQILKTFQCKNLSTLLNLYKIYIRPRLEHNTTLWSPWLKKDILKIESVQRNYTRKIFMRCGISFSSYSDRLQKANLWSLQYRRSIFDLHLLFKIIHNLSDLQFQDYFTTRTSSYQTRGNTNKIYTLENFNNSQWTNSFFVRTARLWNLLPDQICNSNSLQIFKNKLENFDLTPHIHQLLD